MDIGTDEEPLLEHLQLFDVLVVAMFLVDFMLKVFVRVDATGGLLDLLALARLRVLGQGARVFHPLDQLLNGDKVDILVLLHLLDELVEALAVALHAHPLFAQEDRERGTVFLIISVEVVHEQVKDFLLARMVVQFTILQVQQARRRLGTFSSDSH